MSEIPTFGGPETRYCKGPIVGRRIFNIPKYAIGGRGVEIHVRPKLITGRNVVNCPYATRFQGATYCNAIENMGIDFDNHPDCYQT